MDDVQRILYHRFSVTNPELLQSAITDRQMCFDILSRVELTSVDVTTFEICMFAFSYYWPPDLTVIQRCYHFIDNRMLSDDYRAQAIAYLQKVHEASRNQDTIRRLLFVITDDINEPLLRLTAYYAFLSVIDHRRGFFDSCPESIQDINWHLVRQWSGRV